MENDNEGVPIRIYSIRHILIMLYAGHILAGKDHGKWKTVAGKG